MSKIKMLVGPAWVISFIGFVIFSMFTGMSNPMFFRSIAAWVLVVMVSMILIPFVLCGIDKLFKTQISCDTFDWHNGSGGPHSFDGCSVHATCGKCGKKVMQDSQGNWF